MSMCPRGAPGGTAWPLWGQGSASLGVLGDASMLCYARVLQGLSASINAGFAGQHTGFEENRTVHI